MGMFDDINFVMDCPSCGERVTSFQSKDGPCYLEKLEPDEVRNFYASCPKCQTWIEFSKPDPPRRPARHKPLTVEEVQVLGFQMSCQAHSQDIAQVK